MYEIKKALPSESKNSIANDYKDHSLLSLFHEGMHNPLRQVS
jgi:hypothetical protein